jgi:hypothetical protein
LSNVGLDSIEVLQDKAQGDSIRVPGGVTQRCMVRRQTGETYYPTLKRHRHVQVIQLKHLGGICLSLHRNTLMRSECWVAGWCDQRYRSSAACPNQLRAWHYNRLCTETLESPGLPSAAAANVYRWSTAGLPLVYHWSTAGLPLVYHWSTAGLPLVYHWSTTGLPLVYHWSTTGLPWSTTGLPLVYHWSTTGLPLVYRWSTAGLPLVYHWSTLVYH